MPNNSSASANAPQCTCARFEKKLSTPSKKLRKESPSVAVGAITAYGRPGRRRPSSACPGNLLASGLSLHVTAEVALELRPPTGLGAVRLGLGRTAAVAAVAEP